MPSTPNFDDENQFYACNTIAHLKVFNGAFFGGSSA
jgi:hypothetical protein